MAWSLVNEMPLSDWTFTFNRSGRDRKFKAKGPGVDPTLALLCALAPEEPKSGQVRDDGGPIAPDQSKVPLPATR